MRVDVYWNLNKQCFSVRHKGRVIAHVPFIELKDITWVVQPRGRARVLRERRKNVHAFARGTWLYGKERNTTPHPHDHAYKRIIYDPYEYDTFVTLGTETPVYSSDFARLSTTYNTTHNFYGPRVAIINVQQTTT